VPHGDNPVTLFMTDGDSAPHRACRHCPQAQRSQPWSCGVKLIVSEGLVKSMQTLWLKDIGEREMQGNQY
jgi:hypothetical protein